MKILKNKVHQLLNRKFKNIFNSKNSDKLVKIHRFQDLVNYLNYFRELVVHTNRLFLYQIKINLEKIIF